jgi:hypothetical protein
VNNDRLYIGGNPERLRQSAYRVITRSQDEPEVQVMAMAVALYATCDALNVDIRQLLVSCERMKGDLDGPFTNTFDALREYAQQEIGR